MNKRIGSMLIWTVMGALVVSAAGRSARLFARQSARTLTATMPAKIANRQMQPVAEGTRRGVRLDAHEGDGIAWWPDAIVGDCTIEVDLRGKNVLQQSFVGVAFHGVDEKTFDAVYFRPFNFKAEDAARRLHSVQYVSHPIYTWDKLRAERPEQFERAIAAAPDPDGWFHVQLVVAFPSVRVFVNDIAAPVMDIKQLSDRKTGWIGLWVGNNSDGQFANLTVR
jgi:hypothetical protein